VVWALTSKSQKTVQNVKVPGLSHHVRSVNVHAGQQEIIILMSDFFKIQYVHEFVVQKDHEISLLKEAATK
jgi:hypothetical protein